MMPPEQPDRSRSYWRCFAHALRGGYVLIRSQTNAQLHLLATFAAAALGLGLRISRFEWCWIITAVALVWMAEALNTAIEFLGDEVSREHRLLIGRAKDLGAASVLMASGAALLIGLIVFAPHVRAAFN